MPHSPTADVVDVAQLVLRERRSRDRGWYDEMRECFAPDGTVRISWFHGTCADFVTQTRILAARGDIATHRIGPPIVDAQGDRALAEVSAHVEVRTTLDDTPVELTTHARLVYRAERREGRWLLVSLDPVYERDTMTASRPGDRIDVPPSDLEAFRRSYRMLAYAFSRRGYTVSDDLYGDDRPEAVTRLRHAGLEWLRG